MKERFVIQHYHVANKKNNGSFRIAFLSDLHNRYFGRHQEKLMDELRRLRPDIVLLGGDIVDDRNETSGGYELISQVSSWPCYYVCGNHEVRTGNLRKIKRRICAMGVEVLEGDWRQLTLRGCQLVIAGADDPEAEVESYYRQLAALERAPREQAYTIFLQHRPERIEEYLPLQFDLMLAGHAHGGQWRIPGLINGVYAPGQGIFPRYAGGSYRFEDQILIVGRGLAGKARGIPRIFNPPELVIIDIDGCRERNIT